MINIVEAGKNIEKERKIEMIADIEVYTVMNALIIGAQSIFLISIILWDCLSH